MSRAAGRRAAGAALAAALSGSPATADDLRDALAQAYRSNPTLLGARADLRATDEQVAVEKASGLPELTADAQYTEFVKNSVNNVTAPDRAFAGTVSLTVPVYQGGAVKNAVRAATTRVAAGQANLRATESAVFSQVVAAYMDVTQNEAIVGLNRNNVQVLEVNLQATSDRFEIGDLTRTDVAQSRSRLALAQGDTRTAEANLASARETYIRLVGTPPHELAPPPALPGLPASAEEAVAAALADNPDILAAHQASRAAEYDIDVAGASRLPRLDIVSSGGYDNYFGTIGGRDQGEFFAQHDTSAQIGVRATLPLYQGGRPAALRRQAQERAGSTFEQEIATERSVIAQTRAAYSAWQAAQDIVARTQVAVDAASLSLEGVRAENSVGNRTILDILDAEQELLRAQVRLVTASRDAYVAGFTLLAAMGRAEARDLGLDGGALYDPVAHYRKTQGRWSDWSDNPAPVAEATRTVDTPVQDGNISAQKMRDTEVQPDAPAR